MHIHFSNALKRAREEVCQFALNATGQELKLKSMVMFFTNTKNLKDC